MDVEHNSTWNSVKGDLYHSTLTALQRDINSATDLNAAMNQALNTVVRASHAEVGTFWVFDEKTQRIYPKATLNGGILTGFSLAPGEGIAGQVISRGQSLIIADCRQDVRWAKKVDIVSGFQTKTMICVPLLVGSRIFGCIQVINKTDNADFDDKDLKFIEGMAQSVGELFFQHNLCEAAPCTPDICDQAFSIAFDCKSVAQLESSIISLLRFKQLDASDQSKLLRNAKEIWAVLNRNEPNADKKKWWSF